MNILTQNESDYICLTDIARSKDPERTDYLISNWMRNRNTVEFLGIWEQLHNPDFNPIEFDGIKKQTGLNSFVRTAKQWSELTGAIGLISKPGRYGGTYAHKDIAFEFASWISVEFKLYLIKEFQRLKDEENDRLKLDWKTSPFQSFSFYSKNILETAAISPECPPMNLATKLRESRSKHPLTSYDAAVKQLRAFREVLPITRKNSEFSGTTSVKKTSTCTPLREN